MTKPWPSSGNIPAALWKWFCTLLALGNLQIRGLGSWWLNKQWRRLTTRNFQIWVPWVTCFREHFLWAEATFFNFCVCCQCAHGIHYCSVVVIHWNAGVLLRNFAGYMPAYLPYICYICEYTAECFCSHKLTRMFFPFSEVGWHPVKHMDSETYVSIPFPPHKDYCLGFILQPLGTSISHTKMRIITSTLQSCCED